MKVRIKFKKYGVLRFISHLDVMRYFRKAFMRAGIPIKFSEGLSPHMIMSFASPLTLGFASEGEYFDIELKDAISVENTVGRLNKVMAKGIEVVSIRQIPKDRKTACAAILSAADYLAAPSKLRLPDDFAAKINEFLSLPQIIAARKTKLGEKPVDIRPLIYQMEARGQDIFMRIAAGSSSNLKPELAIESFCGFAGIVCADMGFEYCRLEMYATINKDGETDFISLEGPETETSAQ